MKTRILNLAAGVQSQDREGGAVLIVESSSGGAFQITWLDAAGNHKGTILNASAGKKYRPGFEFSGYELQCANNSVVTLIVGYGDADVADLTAFITNTAANPVPIDLLGAVFVPAPNFTVDDSAIPDAHPVPVKLVASIAAQAVTGPLTDAQLRAASVPVLPALAAAITDNAAVAVTAVLTAVLAADAARREVRFYNQGPDAVAIGGAGLTWAKRAVVLEVGDSFVETAAPGAVIKAICDATLTASLGVQVVA